MANLLSKDCGGIYKIINIINNKIYIGCAQNFVKRKSKHFSMLRNNKHHNKHLQNAYNKYGPDAFVFEILEIIKNNEQLTIREQYWFDLLNPAKNGYNFCMTSRRRAGFKQPKSTETKEKISESLKGFKVKEETKTKISISMKGKNLGKKQTEEFKKHQSDLKLGKYLNENGPSAKLKWVDIPIIFQQLNSGIKITEIAKTFNVGLTTIYNIKAGKRWVSS